MKQVLKYIIWEDVEWIRPGHNSEKCSGSCKQNNKLQGL
jgi:hypothetical protein